MSDETPKTCPVSVYNHGTRIVVGEATFEENEDGVIAHINLHDHMPSFLEAFTEGILTGLTITPERASVKEMYDKMMEKYVESRSIEGETVQYKKEN